MSRMNGDEYQNPLCEGEGLEQILNTSHGAYKRYLYVCMHTRWDKDNQFIQVVLLSAEYVVSLHSLNQFRQ